LCDFGLSRNWIPLFLWVKAWLVVDVVAFGVESSGKTEASRKQADSMRAQSIRVCILSQCMEEAGRLFPFLFSFCVMEMEIGIRRETTMTEMVNDDEETSSSVIIYLFILEFIRFSLATPIPRWSGLLYDIYDDMDDIEIVFTQ
jgi:hypothetical protein